MGGNIRDYNYARKINNELKDEEGHLEESKVDYAEGKIEEKCENLKQFLKEKNRKYGNSALEGVGIFSNNDSDASSFIRLSIDHKLKRLKSDQLDDDEDVIKDLIGYLILLMVAEDKEF